jgi:HK97 family phage portal protein
MRERGLISRVKNWWPFGSEGSNRGPALAFSEYGRPFGVSFGDGFQQNLALAPRDGQKVATAYACVMVTAKALAMCYPRHMVKQSDGSYKQNYVSPAARVLHRPNDYQTWPQFLLNAVARLLFEGESFVHVVRDEGGAALAFHLFSQGSCAPYITPEGVVFYSIGASPMEPQGAQFMAPARDIMHLRQYCPRHPLIGESPLCNAALALGINVALSANQAAFFSQMSRPSGVLTTDMPLTKEQMLALRSAFDEQSKGAKAGGLPILGGGLKFTPLIINAQDSQLIEAQRMSIEEIARAFNVPLVCINGSTEAKASTESLINFWLSTGLGAVLEIVERSLDAAFDLPPDQYVELDTAALLRMDFITRVDGLAHAVQGGLMSPNEAREQLALGRIDGGDQIFLQQQMISVDMLSELHASEIAAKNKPPPAPVAPPAAPVPPEPQAKADVMTQEQARELTVELLKRMADHG